MLSESRFVLFLSFVYLVSYSVGSNKRLELFFPSATYVTRCGKDQYLVVNDWQELLPANIPCLDQISPYDHSQESISMKEAVHVRCDDIKKIFDVLFCFGDPSKTYDSNMRAKPVTGAISVDAGSGRGFNAIWDRTLDSLCIKQTERSWIGNPDDVSYIQFDRSSLICRNTIYYAGMVENERCTGKVGKKEFLCYYDLLSDSAVTDIDWEFLEWLASDKSDYGNWRSQGGYFIDMNIYQPVATSVS